MDNIGSVRRNIDSGLFASISTLEEPYPEEYVSEEYNMEESECKESE